ncbi:7663_t:CDS:10 [Paraglomus brasilianum]|uniref:7663_t:CDS:1 n=1 Tax=Paraglomus brasilianum TaxID=144538 RepID=A0A9N9AU19_9GLOM|nr:7663_t:CDS:10 [Paraglomus brasilianum]
MSTNANEDRERIKDLLEGAPINDTSNYGSYDFYSEASDLERELKKQDYQRRQLKNVNEIEQETEFIRNCLKDVYEDIILSDLQLAIEHGIEERLWRHVFYSYVEELRIRLRKNKQPQSHEYQMVYLELSRYLDMGTGFYHTLVNTIKISEGMNLNTIGIDLLLSTFASSASPTPPSPSHKRSSPESHTAYSSRKQLAAECIQRCLIYLGDLARYRECIADVEGNKKWEFAKRFYLTAAKVFLDNGKAQGQLAVLAAYSENDLDIVYWDTFSLATKQPSLIAEDNLQNFYTQFVMRTPEMVLSDAETTEDNNIKLVWQFLSVHLCLFNQDTSSLPKRLNALLKTIETSVLSPPTVTKLVFIIIYTLWDFRRQSLRSSNAKRSSRESKYLTSPTNREGRYVTKPTSREGNSANNLAGSSTSANASNTDGHIKTLQQAAFAVGFALCLRAIENLDTKGLRGSIIWYDYIQSILEGLVQSYAHVKAEREKGSTEDDVAQTFITTVTSFLKFLATFLARPLLSSVSQSSLLSLSSRDSKILLTKRPITEDIEFLGIVPLRPVHEGLDWSVGMYPGAYNGEEYKSEEEDEVRIARVLGFAKRVAEIKTFEIFTYNEQTGMFIFLDEETKKRERQRLMKIMAEQRLREQVTSLEAGLTKLGIQPASPHNGVGTYTEKTCLIDVGVLIDCLTTVKKWIADNHTEVIVPLDAIDVLDVLKKGSDAKNIHARDAIRYLDTQLQKRQLSQPSSLDREHFIRAQNINEKLSSWNEAEEYLIDQRV